MPPRERLPALRPGPVDDVRRRLAAGSLDVLGRVLDASNAAFLARVDDPADAAGPTPAEGGGAPHVIYKPVAGERPLWDFPHGHLAYREVATSLVADAGGWSVVPPTVLRQGPAGPGSAQLWVTPVPGVDPDDDAEATTTGEDHRVDDAFDDGEGDVDDRDDLDDLDDVEGIEDDDLDALYSDDADPAYVRLFAPDRLPSGWLPVLSGELGDGRAVVVAHRDAAELRSLSVLDAVLNNSDRKGSHVLVDAGGRLWGIDHGLTFHVENKLRTVLWGWAGEPLPDADLERLQRLEARLAGSEADAPGGEPGAGLPAADSLVEALDALLRVDEVEALRHRIGRLLRRRTHPLPSRDWPAVPWPAL